MISLIFSTPAKLPANRSEITRASGDRVRLITQVKRAYFRSNTGEGTAESYRWSQEPMQRETSRNKRCNRSS
jgi:hypothetical protein